MKNNYFQKIIFFKMLFLLLGISLSSAQTPSGKYDLLLKSGNYKLEENLNQFINTFKINEVETIDNRYYRLLQFYNIPTQQEKENLEQLGVKLLDYIPNYTYIASISKQFNVAQLQSFSIRSIVKISPEFKLAPDLQSGNYPAWSLVEKDKIDLIINYPSDLSAELIRSEILKNKSTVILKSNDFSHQITIRIPLSELDLISQYVFVSYIETVDPPAEPENLVERTSHRSNVIATDYFSGRHYDGTGVNIAMGDDGIIGPHIDYQGRTNQSNVSTNSGDHGDHVAGTIIGGGNLDPTTRGMAFGADLFVYDVWDAINLTPTSYLTPGIRITSTSYSNGCNAGYTSFARTVDQQTRQMPSLMHVFSSGNSGTSNCGYGAGSNWGNITGGVKIGKNVIAVGNLSYSDGLATSSSRGPAHDGRIKPDVCAVGTNVYSTIDVNSYANKSGTSMACPGVSGTLAQLYHAYRELNSGTDPESGLMKAILMNSADDLGNAGPDYKFGYGRINAARAVRTIEELRFEINTINQGNTNTHNIVVPVNTQQLNVAVYWTDYEATVNASKALVNDINMQVIDPSSFIFDPWVLDPTPNPTTLDLPAVRGGDTLNNIEQVTIENPLSGNYTITIDGFQIPQGPQTYYLVYEFINSDLIVTHPIGGESFVPGTSETIRWDAFGNTGTFILEYSDNNGVTWNTIAGTVNASMRYYNWTPPNIVSGTVLVRVTRGLVSAMSDAPFSIIGVPQNITIPWACPDSIKLTWNAVAGATSYEVSRLGNKYMDSTATSSSNSIVLTGINPSVEDWFSVKAMGATNAIGRRAIAIQKIAGTWNCSIPYDVSLTNVVSPTGGTYQNCQDNSGTIISARLKNTGATSVSNIPVNYKINSGTVISEIFSGTILPGDSSLFNFSATANLSAIGTYNLSVWTSYPTDGNNYNDSSNTNLQVLSGTLITLPWSEDFETFNLCPTSGTCEAVTCNAANGWVNETNLTHDEIDWRTNSGTTPSSGTGPSIDHAPGNSSGKYLYLEASTCFSKKAVIITPCIDLAGAQGPKLSFWYHMYGGSIGKLHIDIFQGGTWTNDVIPNLYGNQGDIWKEKVIDLSSYIGQKINIRFRGNTGTNYTSDMAIDDISISSTTSINDISFLQNVSVYPNPGHGIFNLNVKDLHNNSLELFITDIQGRRIYSRNISGVGSEYNSQIDLSSFASGIYYLHLIAGDKQFHTKLSSLELY